MKLKTQNIDYSIRRLKQLQKELENLPDDGTRIVFDIKTGNISLIKVAPNP